ncbi:spore coat protein CotS [Clostridium sporogenes]|uniref:Spore coat protein CotS n=2 Tax=Clostridium TaxID=1485 RepID=A0A6M0SYQ9_CLOBO|nr:spore coat protein CotS [Clostridium sporogenes]NFA60638.1 spore coat protein CotS [Clostridium botulinum]MDS1003188.1 spore coat protein CotS [Clostridium sporogenes]NFI74192.1 spore coat protein CotS [Clostridium sporogenes]NFL72266.1 spore coat protein CotS [Clostridium sporogenes]NFM25522.1 spore coat protein CotS [Clostridium sporogenes]
MDSLKKITDISHYLESKDINVIEEFKDDFRDLNNLSEEAVIKQLKAVSLFHKNTLGNKNYIRGGIKNKTGSIVEKYKLDLKKINKYIKVLKDKKSSNTDFEKLILEYMPDYTDRAEKVIENIYKNGYINLVWRSMERKEICLGKTYFNNIRYNKGIEVIDISKCSYDMIEMDCIELLYKVNKKNASLSIEKLCESFCEFENLNNESYKFILYMLSYPYSLIKCCMKYMKEKDLKKEKHYMDRFNKAMNFEFNSFV